MTISDLISFLGIVLAIIAFVGEKERQFVAVKFNKFDVFVLLSIFLFINFLLFYDWWKQLLPLLSTFEYSNFPLPSTWGYIIIILSVCWICYKIFFSEFPKANQSKVMNYYNEVLINEDYSFLYKLILKYEKNSLLLNKCNSIHNANLLRLIFFNKDFLIKTSNYNYKFFNDVLLKNTNIYQDGSLDNYIECHLRNPHSFVYNSKPDDLELKDFHMLVNNSIGLEGIINNLIREDGIAINKLQRFIFTFTLNNSNFNDLYKLVFDSIIRKSDVYLIKHFFEDYISHAKSNVSDNSIDIFQTLTLAIIESIDENENSFCLECIVNKYLDLLLLMIEKERESTRFILLDTFKNKRTIKSKFLIDKIYNKYYEKNDIENSFIDLIFNDIFT
jgi:hypothetical protein